jgi:ribosomal protein S18 acetylase RimI-like enzyme
MSSIDKKIFEQKQKEIAKPKIEQIASQDWEVISQIQKNDGFDHADYLDQARIEKLMQRGELFYGTYLEGKPAGFAALDFEKRAEIRFFSILKEYQNSGISHELMSFILEQCKARKYDKVSAAIEKSGTEMKEFLENNGFEEVGFYKDRFGEGRDALFFSKNL